jgi:hypothetical protein
MTRVGMAAGSVPRVTSVLALWAPQDPSLGTPEPEHAGDLRLCLPPPTSAAKLTSVEDQGSMYAPRIRDH